jgi:flagellin
LNVINEATTGLFKRSVSSFRDTGTDADAKINGLTASSSGNQISINTSSLGMSIDLLAETNGNFNFAITGGGAQFQLGPDVVSNQQLRIGIQSVNTARLGGVNGRLYQLAEGNNADLDSNPNLAAKIVDEAGTAITTLRGRLGAIQGLTMLSNQNTLEDMVQNMQTSLSLIQDTDFAAETANLTRAQILTQANMSVLSIANQQPQQVLSLLPRG